MDCFNCDNKNSKSCEHRQKEIIDGKQDYKQDIKDVIWYQFLDCIYFCRPLMEYWNKRSSLEA